MSRRRTTRCTVAIVTAAVLLAACGNDAEVDRFEDEDEPVVDTDLDLKPELLGVLPDDRGDPPGDLVVDDLVVGDGPAASQGEIVTVHFVGAEWVSGAEFDATWDRGQPFTFELGAGRVIEGWERGVIGMRVGGRRALVVPPDLAYGDRGAAGGVEPGATLVFIVDLLDAQAAS